MNRKKFDSIGQLHKYKNVIDWNRIVDNGVRYKQKNADMTEFYRRQAARDAGYLLGKAVKQAARMAGLEISGQLARLLSVINGASFDEVRARAKDYRLAGKVKQ
tara:strand:- start:751 stop:1062 length:312 start_codon:yes stop_codon:yes gene_type:complete